MKPLNLPIAMALSLAIAGTAAAATQPKSTKPDETNSSGTAPVAQPETDAAVSTSGALVPNQPVRPESTQEADVPKTPMDKTAANSADVGADKMKTNQKAQRSGSGGH